VARERFGLTSDMLVMAIVANLIPYKGHADLLEALGLIASQIQRRWVLLVAGRDDGPGMELKKRAEALGIGSNIRWLGLIDNVNLLWRAADIGVLASHQEGLPNSLLEAMAVGVPMVATRVGGVSDIATDGKECLLVAPRDPIGMASALLRLAQSEKLRSQLALAATTRVRACFALHTCVERYKRLYDLMLQHNDLTNGAHVCRQFNEFNDGAANEIPAASLQILKIKSWAFTKVRTMIGGWTCYNFRSPAR